jgi:hypothetical protein
MRSAVNRQILLVMGRSWCDVVLIVHIPIEDKSDDTRDSFYKELDCVFDQYPK